VTVAIDSQILIYAGVVPLKQKALTPTLKDLRRRSTMLLDLIIASEKIVLPMIAISELLITIPEDKKAGVVAVLTKRFICPQFDLQAAVIASNLWREYKKLPADQQYRDRQVMRSDAMIVATAKAAGATAFYTNDNNCRRMAALVMEGRGIPKRHPDGNLFEKQEAAEDDAKS